MAEDLSAGGVAVEGEDLSEGGTPVESNGEDLAQFGEPVISSNTDAATFGQPNVVTSQDNLERAGRDYYSLVRAGLPTKTGDSKMPSDPLVNLVEPLSDEEIAAMNPADRLKAGIFNASARNLNQLTSPDNLALLGSTLGVGGAVPAIGRAASLVFAGMMAKELPHIARQLGEEYAKPPEQRDPVKIGQLIGDGAFATGFAALGGAHGLRPGAGAAGTDLAERDTSAMPGAAPADLVKAAIATARKNGPSPEFRAFFSGMDPEAAGTTPEKVAAFAKSLGMKWRAPTPPPAETPPETGNTEVDPFGAPRNSGIAPSQPAIETHEEILYPDETLNVRGGTPTKSSEVSKVVKIGADSGKNIYQILYSQDGQALVGYSENAIWENHRNYTGASKWQPPHAETTTVDGNVKVDPFGAPQPAPAPEPVAEDEPVGTKFAATTPVEGVKVSGYFDVVPASDLVTSFDPGYDAALQPRDRTRSASLNQITTIAQKFEPQRMGDSPTTDMGSPMVDERNQVLSGNGRTTALRSLYGAGAGDGYKGWLAQNAADFGLDPERIAAMQHPVLVRRVADYGGLDKVEFARQSNQQQVLGMGEAEKAVADAKMLAANPHLIEAFRPGEDGNVLAASNREFLNKFIQGTGDQASLLTKDGYNAAAVTKRVKNAVLGAFIGPENQKLMGQLLEGADELNIKNAVNGTMAVAPALMRFKGTPYDLSSTMHQALKDLVSLRSTGEKLHDFLNDRPLFADPTRTAQSDLLLEHLHEARSMKAVTEGLQRYAASAAQALADTQSGGLFGLTPASREQILSRAYGKGTDTVRGAQADLSMGESPAGEASGPGASGSEDASSPPGATAASEEPEGGEPGELVTHGMGPAAARGGPRAPHTPRPAPAPAPPMPGAPSAPVPAPPPPSIPGAAARFAKDAHFLRSLFAPQTAGPAARFSANLLRELNAKMANRLLRADDALREYRASFDRTQVPKHWKFTPGVPLPRNYQFIDAYEGGRAASLGPVEARAALEFKRLNDEWLDRIHALDTGALATWIHNYFPHIWEDPTAAAKLFAASLAKRPLEGPKSFLRQRTYQLFREGLEAGLKPVHDNPVDLFLLKHREVERFILGRQFVNEMKAANLVKFVHAMFRAPDGWAKVDDRAFTVFGPPTVTVKEAFDAGMRAKTLDVLAKLGVPHERLTKIGGERWGFAQYEPGKPGTERITSKFGGPDFVLWHELGHALDNRYPDLRERLMGTKAEQAAINIARLKKTPLTGRLAYVADLNEQLRQLADLRGGATPPTKTFGRYVRSAEEKMAVVLQAYLHAPDLMAKTAPAVKAEMAKFLASHPELNDIESIRPTLELGSGEAEQAHGGLLTMGHWYMPADAATVVKNYLSPGLQRFGAYSTFRQASNILNAAQLGLSAFHLGFTSLDAAVSRLAAGIEDLSRGKVISGLKTVGSVPFSPVTNIMQGARVRAEVLKPGSGTPEIQAIVKSLEAAGGRVGQDAFWQTEFTRRMLRAFHEGTATGYVKGAVQAPFALVEQVMRPIMEYVVPRQKLGVFADLARRELDRLGPTADPADVREAMRKAWDSVDNRMGQVVYDNLFYNRVVKDLALLSFRAYGWQLGKYRELGGAAADVVAQANAIRQGKRPELTHRMAYALALPILVGALGALTQYLMTGRKPEEWRDYFMPRTGDRDANGREARINLPSYMKDIIAMGRHPLGAVSHSLNPAISGIADMLQNRDYYDTRIFNPDDPLTQKMKDLGLYLGKEFMPFSISGAMKMSADNAPLQKQILPFFGITPAPQRLLMTPAETYFAEAMADRMPKGAQTREQFDRGQLLKEIVAGMKSPDAGKQADAQARLNDGITKGMLNAAAMQTMIERLKYTPLQFQAAHADAETAMRGYRLATPAEQAQLYPIVATKVANSKSLAPEKQSAWLQELKASQPANPQNP